jgi:hypothetical protein
MTLPRWLLRTREEPELCEQGACCSCSYRDAHYASSMVLLSPWYAVISGSGNVVTAHGYNNLTDAEREARIAQYIERDPKRPWPGSGRIKDFHTSIWTLIGHYQHGAGQRIEMVARDYHLPVQAVETAILFYRSDRRARMAIDGHLAANEPPA